MEVEANFLAGINFQKYYQVYKRTHRRGKTCVNNAGNSDFCFFQIFMHEHNLSENVESQLRAGLVQSCDWLVGAAPVLNNIKFFDVSAAIKFIVALAQMSVAATGERFDLKTIFRQL